jgi:hypothetical protein
LAHSVVALLWKQSANRGALLKKLATIASEF